MRWYCGKTDIALCRAACIWVLGCQQILCRQRFACVVAQKKKKFNFNSISQREHVFLVQEAWAHCGAMKTTNITAHMTQYVDDNASTHDSYIDAPHKREQKYVCAGCLFVCMFACVLLWRLRPGSQTRARADVWITKCIWLRIKCAKSHAATQAGRPYRRHRYQHSHSFHHCIQLASKPPTVAEAVSAASIT